jgi:hypothetical protein
MTGTRLCSLEKRNLGRQASLSTLSTRKICLTLKKTLIWRKSEEEAAEGLETQEVVSSRRMEPLKEGVCRGETLAKLGGIPASFKMFNLA